MLNNTITMISVIKMLEGSLINFSTNNTLEISPLTKNGSKLYKRYQPKMYFDIMFKIRLFELHIFNKSFDIKPIKSIIVVINNHMLKFLIETFDIFPATS